MKKFSVLVFQASDKRLEFSLLGIGTNQLFESRISGAIINIGGLSIFTWTYGNIHARIFVETYNHQMATEWVLNWLHYIWPLGSLLDDVNLVVHKFAHQSERPCSPMAVTESVMSMLDDVIPLAETHNAYLISTLKTCWEILSGKAFTIATFHGTIFDEMYKSDTMSGFERIERLG